MGKVTLLDGALGTRLWNLAEQNGVEKVPVWMYNIEHPEFIKQVAKEYAEAGSEIIYTNTFGANAPSVKYSSGYTVGEVVSSGVKALKEALKGTNVKTALSIGPLTELLEPYGDLTEEEAVKIYTEQIGAGVEEKPDYIVLETFIDVEMMRIAATVSKQFKLPVFCTMAFEKVGKTIMGNSVQDVIDALTPLKIDGIGLNCAIVPEQAVPVIKEFVGKTDIPLILKPNAGKPVVLSDGTTTTDLSAVDFAKGIEPALKFISYVGGCCGSTPEFIKEIKKLI